MYSYFIIFYFINNRLLPFLGRFFSKKLSNKIKALNSSILEIIPSSFNITLSIIIYSFALQVSLFLLIDDIDKINKLIPWFNTTYLTLFSFMFYRLLTNYINQSSDKIFNDYPNMRKEMIDFNLRIAMPASNNADVTVNIINETATNLDFLGDDECVPHGNVANPTCPVRGQSPRIRVGQTKSEMDAETQQRPQLRPERIRRSR